MSPLAAQGPSLYEVLVLVRLLTIVCLVIVAAGALAWLHNWWEERQMARRFPPPLTREQLIERGAPPFPLELGSWEDLGAMPPASNVDHTGRPYKVGVDIHTRACTTTSCVCPPARDGAKAGR